MAEVKRNPVDIFTDEITSLIARTIEIYECSDGSAAEAIVVFAKEQGLSLTGAGLDEILSSVLVALRDTVQDLIGSAAEIQDNPDEY